MSSVQIVHQVQLFGQAVLFGCCMLLVYDLIRIFRRVAAHGVVWIAVEDMFFWVISAFVLFPNFPLVSGGRWQGTGICDPGHVSRHAAVWQAVQPGCGEGWNLSASEIVWRCKEFFSGNYETCQNYG